MACWGKFMRQRKKTLNENLQEHLISKFTSNGVLISGLKSWLISWKSALFDPLELLNTAGPIQQAIIAVWVHHLFEGHRIVNEMLQNSTFFFSCVFTCFNVHVLPSLRGKRRPAADTCDEPSVFMTVRAAVCQQQFFAAKTRSCQDRSLWSWRNCLWPHMPHSNFTHNSFTYNSLTLTQSLFHHLHATHTHFLTHNLLTHNLLTSNSLTRNSLVRTCFTQSAFRHLLSLCCLSHPVFTFLLQLIGRSWHVGLSGPLILNLTWWNSQPMVPKFHVRYPVWLASGVQPHSAISKHDVPRSMRMHREHIQYKTFAYFRTYFHAKIHERTKLPCDQQRPWASNLALPNR